MAPIQAGTVSVCVCAHSFIVILLSELNWLLINRMSALHNNAIHSWFCLPEVSNASFCRVSQACVHTPHIDMHSFSPLTIHRERVSAKGALTAIPVGTAGHSPCEQR